MLSAPGVASGANRAGGIRGEKNPGTPKLAAAKALNRFSPARSGVSCAGGFHDSPDDTRFQNSRSRSTLFSTGLPAISAPLMAPIDTPATQSRAHPSPPMPP